MHNIREKENRKCQNAFFPYLQGIRIRRYKREEQKTDAWSVKKKIKQSEKKITALLKILLKKLWFKNKLLQFATNRKTNNKLEIFIKMFLQALKKEILKFPYLKSKDFLLKIKLTLR